jgi:hypothetical protein
MVELCRLIWCALIGLFRSRASLEAEILVLRHQLTVLQRKVPTRPTFREPGGHQVRRRRATALSRPGHASCAL